MIKYRYKFIKYRTCFDFCNLGNAIHTSVQHWDQFTLLQHNKCTLGEEQYLGKGLEGDMLLW